MFKKLKSHCQLESLQKKKREHHRYRTTKTNSRLVDHAINVWQRAETYLAPPVSNSSPKTFEFNSEYFSASLSLLKSCVKTFFFSVRGMSRTATGAFLFFTHKLSARNRPLYTSGEKKSCQTARLMNFFCFCRRKVCYFYLRSIQWTFVFCFN